jgi:hypothetical protein
MRNDYIQKRKSKIENNNTKDKIEKEREKNQINPNFYKKSGGLITIIKKRLHFSLQIE